MKQLTCSLLLTGYLGAVTGITYSALEAPATAQTRSEDELFYNFSGRKIPLTLRQDIVAVDFKQTGGTRGDAELPYLRLQRDLQRSTRGGAVAVQPFGTQYALVNLPSRTRATTGDVIQRVQRLPYVEGTLPVLSQGDRSEVIVLPNELIVAFDPKSNPQQILTRYNLEIIRPIRFSKNRYLVRSTSISGTAILGLANQLDAEPGIISATPNFVQQVNYKLARRNFNRTSFTNTSQTSQTSKKLTPRLAPTTSRSSFQTKFLPWEWHLDSRPMRGTSLPRTDVYAPEAWQQSKDGDGVVVAVIDSFIQWDHPDLSRNIYKIKNVANKLPGEIQGWDFAQNDADTRISQDELAALKNPFQDTFRLSDAQLLEKLNNGEYAAIQGLKYCPEDLSQTELVSCARFMIRAEATGEFHGTSTAGVIAARPLGKEGVLGVAPKAKILPIRVFGLGGAISQTAVSEAIRYAGSRGADVINMSLGGPLATEEEVQAFSEVLNANPKLVVIAAAGNENLNEVACPGAIPGVVAVGATNLAGNIAPYSNYGPRLDVVAPGGDTSKENSGGILTIGGTFLNGFWQGITVPSQPWGAAFDPRGKYVQVEGTSFSAPTVAGVMALMKGEDTKRRLNRDRLIAILKKTASYQGLAIPTTSSRSSRAASEIGLVCQFGDSPVPESTSPQQYFFGNGLVNAQKAVLEVKRSR